MGEESKPAPRRPFTQLREMPRGDPARRKIAGSPAEIKIDMTPVMRSWS